MDVNEVATARSLSSNHVPDSWTFTLSQRKQKQRYKYLGRRRPAGDLADRKHRLADEQKKVAHSCGLATGIADESASDVRHAKQKDLGIM